MIRIFPRSYPVFVKRILRNAIQVAPRGEPTHEMVNANLWLPNPRDRLVTGRPRRLNAGFGILEFVAMANGQASIEPFVAMIPSYSKFSSNGTMLDGAYGPRVIQAGQSQLDEIVRMLRKDPSTRRAVMQIFSSSDTFNWELPTKSVPCTIALQFMIRDGSLDMITTMRSNDLYLGLPYDMLSFTLLQEFLAIQLGVPLGNYFHNAGSLHAYDRDLPKLIWPQFNNRWGRNGMEPIRTFTYLDLKILWDLAVAAARPASDSDDNIGEIWSRLDQLSSEGVEDLARSMLASIYKRRNHELAITFAASIEDPTLRHVTYGVVPYFKEKEEAKDAAPR